MIYPLSILLVFILLLAGCAQPVLSVRPAPVYVSDKQVLEESRFPQADMSEIHSVPIPEYKQWKLDNGIRVFFIQDSTLPVVYLNTVILSGSAAEPVLSTQLMDSLSCGAGNWSSEAIARKLMQTGADFDYTLNDLYSSIETSVLNSDLDIALELMASQIRRPAFENACVERKRKARVVAERLNRTSGQTLARRLFFHLAYPEQHPYHYPEIPLKRYQKIDKSELERFHQKEFAPENSLLFISGDVSEIALKDKLNKYFSHWKSNLLHSGLEYPEHETGRRIDEKKVFYLVHQPASRQVSLLKGFTTLPRNSVDWPILDLATSVLGGGLGSRLFMDLREEKGLTYSIHAHLQNRRYDSPLIITSSTSYHKLEALIEGVNGHVDLLCSEIIPSGELNLHKRRLNGEKRMGMETAKQQIDYIKSTRLLELEDTAVLDYLDTIENVDENRLNKTLSQSLCQYGITILAGDRYKIEPLLRQAYPGYSLYIFDDSLMNKQILKL